MDQDLPTALIQAMVKLSKVIDTCRDIIRRRGRKTSFAVREALARARKQRRQMLRHLTQYGPSWRIEVRDDRLYDVALRLHYLILVVGIGQPSAGGWQSLLFTGAPETGRAPPIIPQLIQRQ
jgi:hypothetical protein